MRVDDIQPGDVATLRSPIEMSYGRKKKVEVMKIEIVFYEVDGKLGMHVSEPVFE